MSKYLRLTFVIIILFLPIIVPLFAQAPDNALWTTIDIKKKFKHGFALNLEQEYRMRDNFSNTDKLQTSLDLSWKPLDFLKGGVAYCMINKNPNNSTSWELRHRYVAYLAGSYDIGRFSLGLKEKFQHTNRVGITADADKANPSNVIRSKVDLTYNIRKSKVTPFVSAEVFYALNEPNGIQIPAATQMITETRYAAGVEYSLKKNLSIEAGYLYSAGKEWDDDALGHNIGGYLKQYTNALVLGLNYTF